MENRCINTISDDNKETAQQVIHAVIMKAHHVIRVHRFPHITRYLIAPNQAHLNFHLEILINKFSAHTNTFGKW